MRIADLWFSALWVLLVPTCRSLALATAKINSNGLFGIPSGGSTSTKTRAQATSIESSASSAEMAPSSDAKRPMHILFLSADTGGGHRASAEALAKQFLIQYPGSTYELADVITDCGVRPYRTLVNSYKRMSAMPIQWKVFYHLSNTKLNEVCSNLHFRLMCGKHIKKRLEAHEPDVIVSVHPAMNHTPLKCNQKISRDIGKHIPFFIVVTDLGSAHCMWFERKVDKLYVASERLYKLARRRGGTAPEDIVMTGLPIRHGFAVQAEKLGGDRTSERGIEYQKRVREELGIAPNKQMILVMGGGEGVGSLSDIVNNLYAELSTKGVDATVCVVCGRNENLQKELLTRNFDAATEEILAKAERRQKGIRGLLGKVRKRNRVAARKAKEAEASGEVASEQIQKGKVEIMPLGFLTNIPEYMVAADVLVSKAGPGTIAEAAGVGLPVMMTSFLPGQEAGNVDVVLESNFGEYQDRPSMIAERITSWLQDGPLLQAMSQAAMVAGNPYAADEIVEDIGRQTVAWMNLNEK